MAGILANEGKTSFGNVYLKGTAQPDLYLGLFKNADQPAATAVMTDITEATAPGSNGYARIALADGDWTESGVTKGLFACAQKTFTCATLAWGDVTGYFITTAATGTAGLLIAVEKYSDSPHSVQVGYSEKPTVSVQVS